MSNIPPPNPDTSAEKFLRPRQIGIIGGEGLMGALFQRLFEGEGYSVQISGPSEDAGYGGLVEGSDVVMVSVPISETEGVIARIAPLLTPGQLLTDLTSIKSAPVAAMLKSPAHVIGCHPLFGPMPSPQGQNVVLCPERPGPYLSWYTEFLQGQGMKVVEMTPQSHDEAMSFIQGLTHFINIAFGRTLQTQQADLQQILKICSPIYQMFFAILCRILSGDAHLYGQIQVSNPSNLPVMEDFQANTAELAGAVSTGDYARVYQIFEEAGAYLGEFKEIARDESDFLIAQMTQYLKNEK